MKDLHSTPEDKIHTVRSLEVELTKSPAVPPKSSAKRRLEFAREHKRTLLWCLYMLWCMLANNFAKTAGQSILGIPQFRKDFGTSFDGNYVLSANWQAAYYGAPQAA